MSVIRRRPLQLRLTPNWTADFVDHPDGLLVAVSWRSSLVKLRLSIGPFRRAVAMTIARYAAGIDVEMPPAEDMSNGVPSETDISEETTDVDRLAGSPMGPKPTKVGG